MDRFGMEEDEPIEHNLITRAIENAQSKVENNNFEMRKHLLEYDDVMNKQREIIYKLRHRALHDETLEDLIREYSEELLANIIDTYYAKEIPPEETDTRGFVEAVFRQFSLPLRMNADELKAAKADELEKKIFEDIIQQYQNRKKEFSTEVMHQLEKFVYQTRLDELWKDNLLDMDHLREGIGLRGYAQQDPLREYQKEAYSLFTSMVERLKSDFIEKLFMVRAVENEPIERPAEPQKIEMSRGEEQTEKKPVVRKDKKVGRNESCPCGSGKKYKKCCGKA
jgi:preprotein translocase subunit SecA